MSFLLHDPRSRFWDINGNIAAGSYLRFFESQTTTPAPVYANAELSVELDPEVDLVANSAGYIGPVYGDSAIVYRRQEYDADDVLQPYGDVDPVHPDTDQYKPGDVILFNGTAEQRDARHPPSLWEVSDGDNGTIDFRDRFPIGASATKVVGTTGGTAPGGTVTTSEDGDHDHGGAVSSESLTEAQGAAHRHFLFVNNTGNGTVDASAKVYKNSNSGGDQEYSMDGTAGTDATVGLSSESDGGDPHAHDITEGGAHTHEVTVASPPWGALWILQRKA